MPEMPTMLLIVTFAAETTMLAVVAVENVNSGRSAPAPRPTMLMPATSTVMPLAAMTVSA
jgi:hypothetical protein